MTDRRERRRARENSESSPNLRNGHRAGRLESLVAGPWITKRRVLLTLFAALLALLGYGLVFGL
ncbi:hypothetical protein [Halorubrum halodurans]|nr:hypothetical protein [Halorubrum halodurans]